MLRCCEKSFSVFGIVSFFVCFVANSPFPSSFVKTFDITHAPKNKYLHRSEKSQHETKRGKKEVQVKQNPRAVCARETKRKPEVNINTLTQVRLIRAQPPLTRVFTSSRAFLVFLVFPIRQYEGNHKFS